MEIRTQHFLWLGLVCILQTFSVYASDENNNFYLSGKFVAGLSEVDEIENSGAITGILNASEDDDAVGGFSGVLGYNWRQFRFEIEYLWRYRLDFGARFSGVPTTIGSDIETQSLMLNGLWEYQNHTRFTPYIGAGLGWAEHDADTKRVNVVTRSITQLDTSTDNFVWALLLGMMFSVNDNWDMDLGYRYSDLGDVEIGPYNDGGRVDMEYQSHDFTVGVSYSF